MPQRPRRRPPRAPKPRAFPSTLGGGVRVGCGTCQQRVTQRILVCSPRAGVVPRVLGVVPMVLGGVPRVLGVGLLRAGHKDLQLELE